MNPVWWMTLLAILVDRVVGDPPHWPHPVMLIGKWINWCDRRCNRVPNSPYTQWWGMALTVSTVGMTFFITGGLMWAASLISPILAIFLQIWLISTTIAWKGLMDSGTQVYRTLVREDLAAARRQVGHIVGRDTMDLSETEVVRATVETLAENLVDAIVAPVFYGALGGAPWAMAYRASNTLDSMVGYKSEKYLRFGMVSARWDDLLNFIPARLTALLLWGAIGLTRGDSKRAWRIMQRDAKKHPSPNGGIPESMVAGALLVELGGTNFYKGIPSYRAIMGDRVRALAPSDILRTVQWVDWSTWLTVALMATGGGIVWALAIFHV